MAWWIQGVFFRWMVRTGGAREQPIGVPAEPHARGAHEAQFMFFGSLWRDPKTEKLVGCLQDSFGVSDVFDVQLTKEVVRFTKRYEKRGDLIHYEFAKRDEISWVGRWRSTVVGDGIARVVITEVPDRFFIAESIQTALAPKPVLAHHDDCCSCDDHD